MSDVLIVGLTAGGLAFFVFIGSLLIGYWLVGNGW